MTGYEKEARQAAGLVTGAQVELFDMLNARERRVFLQEKLIKAYQVPLVSFTLNIPGPVKVLPLVPEAFLDAVQKIDEALRQAGLPVLHREALYEKTGFEAFWAVDAVPESLKQTLVPLEDASRVGRLYDIDIIRQNGSKVSRGELGLPVRKCLLCGQPAHACSRSRNHSVAELTAEIAKILAAAYGS